MNGNDGNEWYPPMSVSDYSNASSSLVDSILFVAEENRNQNTSLNQSSILNAINKVVSFEKPESQKVLKDLLIMTAHMENSMGADTSAYGRKYTNSFMSIDDNAFENIFNPKGRVNDEGRWEPGLSPSQEKWQTRYSELGLPTEKNAILALLKSDNPLAAVTVARHAYANVPDPLPTDSSPESLYNYFKKLYNRGGQKKHQTDSESYKRFLQGYNKYIKEE